MNVARAVATTAISGAQSGFAAGELATLALTDRAEKYASKIVELKDDASITRANAKDDLINGVYDRRASRNDAFQASNMERIRSDH